MTVTTEFAETRLITGEELLAMGDIGPCELVDGRIVPMVPTGGEHGLLESEVIGHLRDFVIRHRLGWVLGGEVGIYTRRNPDRVRGADVIFVSKERLPELPQGYLEVPPDLVVEILSPGDRWPDVQQKVEEYFSIGVQQVWIIEPKERTVWVYSSPTEVQRLGEGDTLRGKGLLEGFALPLAKLFAPRDLL
ncbi:MAG TPA: Uma2 family endonuclease [Chloroflexi bacterium]|nr:Uma2 family endonuclease [Chloroflexota bacterium]